MMPDTTERWNERYAAGDLPWDTGRHDCSLAAVVEQWPIAPCRTLELGCGTGSNAIWLSRQGFDVAAVDLSPLAIESAQKKSQQAGTQVEFVVSDVFEGVFPLASFGFVFDRGCFHSFSEPAQRDQFAEYVQRHLHADGLWFSLIGSKDSPPREMGPPMLSAREVMVHVEPWFEVLRLETTTFDSDQHAPAPAWACLMKKRAV